MKRASRVIIAAFVNLLMSSCNPLTGLIGDILLGGGGLDNDFAFTQMGMEMEARRIERKSELSRMWQECIREQDMEDIHILERYQETIAQIHAERETEDSTIQNVTGISKIQMNRERIILASARQTSKHRGDSLLQIMGDTLNTDSAWVGHPLPQIFITKKLEKKWLKSEKREMLAKGKKNGWRCSKKEIKEKAQQKVLAHSKIMSETMELALRNEMRTRLYNKNSLRGKSIYTEYLSDIINKWDPSFVSTKMQTSLQGRKEKKKVHKKVKLW